MNDIGSMVRVIDPNYVHGKLDLFRAPSPVLLGIVGFDGKLKFLNPAWEHILGLRPEELLDRPLCNLMCHHEHAPAAAAALVDQLLADLSFEPMEFGLRCGDGTCKWFLWHWRLDPEDQVIFIAGYDVSAHKTRQVASLLRSYERSAVPAP